MSDIIVPSTWRERLDELAGRRRDVLLVVGLVVVAVLVALALKSRGEPRIAPPAEGPDPGGVVVASPDVLDSTAPTGEVMLVHVAGAVRRPGLYEMPAGARIADAIDSARGPKPVADLDAINLAEPLTDGQKVDVPRKGEAVAAAPAAPGGAPSPGTSPTAAVDLNSADQATLETIPDVGPVTAQAIIAYRTEVGSFESIEQLLEVSGIGPATLETMRPYVTV